MFRLRAFLIRYPHLVAALVLAALAMRVIVPAGFMPVFDHGRVTLALCSGFAPAPVAAPAHAAMPGMSHHAGMDHDKGEKPPSPCAFADLALPVLGGADPVQLAIAILYILATALLLLVAPVVRTAPRLRPPLRAPPLPA